jgi:hypothetical protein
MKILLALLIALPLAAQQADPKPAPEEKKADSKPAAEEKKAEAPPPVVEKNVSGSIEFGYRFRSEVRGREDTYRSLVDLEKGPRLFDVDFSIQNPSRRLFDRIDVSAGGWGGEPQSHVRVDARKAGAYRLLTDYRNIAYFNSLASFADPAIAAGSFLSDRTFDINRRYLNADLELLPSRRITPYLGYTHDAGFGTGVTTYVAGASNEYPVWNRLRDKTDLYRGGVRVQFNRFHVTLEQGGTKFKDDQFVGTADRNFGDRTTPLLDQILVLNNLSQAYGIRGDSIYSKALVTAAPASWVDLFGQFVYSRPSSDVKYSNNAQGLFALLGTTSFFNSQYDVLYAQAKQPHTSGNVGFELRPVKKVRVVESILTDRFHNASSTVLAEQLLFGTTAAKTTEQVALVAADRMVYNFNRQQVDVIVDLTSRLSLRGGHRYEWGDAQVRSGSLNLAGSDAGELKRQVGLVGVNFRPLRKLNLSLDYEQAAGDRSYFRTSLYDSRKIRARARYQLLPSLMVAANFTSLDNRNPTAGVNYDFASRSSTMSIQWMPQGGKRISLLGEYSRSSLSSDLTYLDPLFRSRERSYYWDNAHVANALLDINLPAMGASKGKMSLGGSMFLSHGSRPTSYYQPIWRLQMPLFKHVQWFGEWRWYGYSEPFYLYEGFRAHLFQTGLRLNI